MTLGEKLSALRQARGISQETLAEKIGVSRQAVSKWELNDAAPEIDKLTRLADFYGVTTDYLLRPEQTCTSPNDTPAASPQKHCSPIEIFGIGLTGLVICLLIQFYGTWIAYRSIVTFCGLLAQILFFSCTILGLWKQRSSSPLFYHFLRASAWLMLLTPCVYVVQSLFYLYPRPFFSFFPHAIGVVLYLVLCTFLHIKLPKQKN